MIGLVGLMCALLVSVLAASASAESYTKTMVFNAKRCHARVRDMPQSARIDSMGGDKGDLIYGHASPYPNMLSFTCVDGAFSEVKLYWVLEQETTSACYLPGTSPSVRRKWYQNSIACTPYYSSPVPGTNIETVNYTLCGGAGSRDVGASRDSRKGCVMGYDYVLTLGRAWVLLEPDPATSSQSPHPWMETMLENSTFKVGRWAGGNPNAPGLDDTWNSTLPDTWGGGCTGGPSQCGIY